MGLLDKLKDVNENAKEKSKANKELKKNNLFFDGRIRMLDYVLLDDDKKEIHIATSTVNGKIKTSKEKVFPYSSIEDYEIYVEMDEKKSKGAVGGLTGAVIAGPVGLAIGALAKRGNDKTKIGTAGLKITIKDDIYSIKTVKNATKKAAEPDMVTTEKIGKRLDAILGKSKKANAGISADELLKYKELLDAGVITKKEFEQKKSELL